ncbi:Proteophosphoglycan 5 [Mycena indigotica]|uniref:Proteophosphoglycan 5 n=1 Tax=Mycena indigotica TaxID=2126181 RepID=A0A8H6T859_9AGAR|nr:Proteophosphoglycan 5 [Mycena indigotica]KAF7311712.1 Proteophosphoglycan 5 [Mycena indigotica]
MSSYHHHRRSEFNFWDKGASLCVRAPYVTVLTKNISVMTVYCDRCDRYFPHYGALAQHERASSAHWLCDDCEIDTTWTGLKEHYVQSRRHFYCQHCDEHFDDGGELAEHMDDAHFYCSSCERVFKNEQGLHEHCRQSSVHHYCTPCRRLFTSANNLNAHMNSALHKPRTITCPGRGCGQSFINGPSLAAHLEAGSCAAGREPAVAQPLHPRRTRAT